MADEKFLTVQVNGKNSPQNSRVSGPLVLPGVWNQIHKTCRTTTLTADGSLWFRPSDTETCINYKPFKNNMFASGCRHIFRPNRIIITILINHSSAKYHFWRWITFDKLIPFNWTGVLKMSNELKIFPKIDFPIILKWRGAATNFQTSITTDGMLVSNIQILFLCIKN